MVESNVANVGGCGKATLTVVLVEVVPMVEYSITSPSPGPSGPGVPLSQRTTMLGGQVLPDAAVPHVDTNVPPLIRP
jgi:hypothetical protein